MSLKRSFIVDNEANILWVVWDGGVDMHERIYINFLHVIDINKHPQSVS